MRERAQFMRLFTTLPILVIMSAVQVACVRQHYVEQLKFADQLSARGARVTILRGPHAWLGYLIGLENNRVVVSVSVNNECLTDNNMRRMPTLFALRHFDALSAGKLTDDELAWVPQAGTLEELNLNNCTGITDRALDYISKSRTLLTLGLSETEVDDRGLERLEQIPTIDDLDISCTRINKDGLARLATFRALRALCVGGAAIDDKTIPILAKLQSLVNLVLWKSRITESGTSGCGNCFRKRIFKTRKSDFRVQTQTQTNGRASSIWVAGANDPGRRGNKGIIYFKQGAQWGDFTDQPVTN